VWADGGYAGKLVEWAKATARIALEIVRKTEGQHGFEVLPRRWVVERTLSWITACRRLDRDYERLPETSEAMVKWAMIGLMTRRLAPGPTRVQDRDGGRLILAALRKAHPTVAHVWADGGYAGKLVEWAKEAARIALEIVRKTEGQHGFEVLPRRWVVERTLSWITACRRLDRDYERLPETSEAMVKWAMIGLMTRRLAPGPGRQPWSTPPTA